MLLLKPGMTRSGKLTLPQRLQLRRRLRVMALKHAISNEAITLHFWQASAILYEYHCLPNQHLKRPAHCVGYTTAARNKNVSGTEFMKAFDVISDDGVQATGSGNYCRITLPVPTAIGRTTMPAFTRFNKRSTYSASVFAPRMQAIQLNNRLNIRPVRRHH